MDMNKQELAAVQLATVEVPEAEKELSDLELALVGGGCGDISLG